ncbi:protein of unknown function [Methylacidimicrobium sp. AP8]|uniref:hypothetical protein n=1 Tax=Methylacidimicrobium sp. AP8 TaxID=2730359 RepID=UPI0018BFA810|nr:hypothetical protein [Methylacidimicrobium sp. AP8]CAB4244023.1 protein of unknown function [Methylacidimicrobium sp. AP8]
MKAAIGDACREIARACAESGKPLVIERLDLRKRRAELEAVDGVRARSLSSFAYAKTNSMLKAASFRAGVKRIEVDPAYTSVIGAVNHARRHGIGSHQGAAYAVARRGWGLSERPSVREAVVPTRNGGHLTFALPARNRTSRSGRTFGRGSKRRMQRMPGREATICLPRLCSRNRGHWALPGLCRRNPGTRTVGNTVRLTSWTIFPGRGTVVYGFRNG